MTSRYNGTGSRQTGSPLQFTLLALLLVTVGVAMALSIVVASPHYVAVPVLMCLAIAVPAVLTIVVIYGTRCQRTFCAAALFPTGTVLFATLWLVTVTIFDVPGGDLDDLEGWVEFFDEIAGPYRVYSAASWLLGMMLGCTSVWLRWHLERWKERASASAASDAAKDQPQGPVWPDQPGS